MYYSWRWTRTASETCRVIINQVKQKLHLVVYLLIQYCYSPTRLNGIKLGSNFIFCPSVTHQDSFSAHDVVSVPRFLSHLQFLFFFVLFSFFFFPSYLWFFLVLFSLPSSSSSSCSSSSSTTIRRGSWLPIQSSIRSGVWPLYASFFVLLPADPLQPHESILSVVFLFFIVSSIVTVTICLAFFRYSSFQYVYITVVWAILWILQCLPFVMHPYILTFYCPVLFSFYGTINFSFSLPFKIL